MLYFDSQTERSSDSVESSKKRLHVPTRGRSQNPVEARALQTVRTRLPCQWTSEVQKTGNHQNLKKRQVYSLKEIQKSAKTHIFGILTPHRGLGLKP